MRTPSCTLGVRLQQQQCCLFIRMGPECVAAATASARMREGVRAGGTLDVVAAALLAERLLMSLQQVKSLGVLIALSGACIDPCKRECCRVDSVELAQVKVIQGGQF